MKVKTRIFGNVLVTAMAVMLIGTGINAYFSDVETSIGNSFAAGSLDLQLDGGDVNVVKFSVANMKPGDQPIKTFALKNVGSLNGYLDLENITVTNNENGRIEPEISAGDTTDVVGELGAVVSINLFWDQNGDGWYGPGDVYIQNNCKMNALASHYESNEPLNAGQTKYITAQVNWWSTPLDNQAMTDSSIIDISFELGQTTAQ